ncbi:hypothetical protein TBR22_A30130 [Luteitalea sp. TBR-22]|uniref:flavin monoamine oxidase family protein n=1 Tax=Luteitalea sp. TBR-22 TaxID=2802971 RepID=UPI001AF4716D|nr:FAD-dependent oxidoreductase [Luteitalea sp. TBR-22]BCS33786.1 hypothetical protein TBR22_A30130 [Luteitalea sp. TBR-22]
MPGRSPLFNRLARVMRAAAPTTPQAPAVTPPSPSRRAFLAHTAALAAVAAGGRVSAAGAPRVAIVGAGLAGLLCADRLQSGGIVPVVYEGQARVGGRCRSLRGFFPGQVAELGGELIDTQHKTMLGLANRFGLALEDMGKQPGEETFFFGGTHYTEDEVIAEYRVLAPRMREDMKTSSGAPTAFSSTPGDVALDNTDLATYLATRAADLPLIRALITIAYEGEYGLPASQQSCLNLLLFIHADRRSYWQPWGVFSDERYHVVDGNDRIAQGLLADFSGVVEYGRALRGLRRTAFGDYELRFASGAPVTADVVVVTLPFSVLRTLDLDPSLGLSNGKRHAIDTLGYGTNAKTMVGFGSAPWSTQYGGNGSAYTDLANVQQVWETNPTRHGAGAILTDFASGPRGAQLRVDRLQSQVSAWLGDLDTVWPGVAAAASRDGRAYRAALAPWPTSPWALGSYTCYRPGQFTTVAGYEGQRAGHLHFAGEHTDSFYSWQGFMEGACLSGLAAANAILADVKKGLV